MKQQFVSGQDPYERVEFDYDGIDGVDKVSGQQATPKLVIKTNSGQALEFKLTGKSAEYKALADWATEAAAALEAQGR